jgi:hypothetical protein
MKRIGKARQNCSLPTSRPSNCRGTQQAEDLLLFIILLHLKYYSVQRIILLLFYFIHSNFLLFLSPITITLKRIYLLDSALLLNLCDWVITTLSVVGTIGPIHIFQFLETDSSSDSLLK